MNSYQRGVMQTAKWQLEHRITYPILALAGEAGEVANTWKKYLRGDDYNKNGELDNDKVIDRKLKILDELGDVLYYVAAVAHDIGRTLEDVARYNQVKLGTRYGVKYED